MELRVVRKRECGDEESQVRANQSPIYCQAGRCSFTRVCLPGCRRCEMARSAQQTIADELDRPDPWERRARRQPSFRLG